MPEAHSRFNCSTIISICESYDSAKGMKEPTPDNISAHYKFYFDDTSNKADKWQFPPTKEDIVNILDVYNKIIEVPTYLHCFAGYSRSPAVGFILFCKEFGPGQEEQALEATLRASLNDIFPNQLMVEYGDEILGRNGAMIKVLREGMAEQKKKLYSTLN
jgi:predicted protein tyrosine phosphatase